MKIVRGTAPARRAFPDSLPKNYTNENKSGGSKTNATASSKLNKYTNTVPIHSKSLHRYEFTMSFL